MRGPGYLATWLVVATLAACTEQPSETTLGQPSILPDGTPPAVGTGATAGVMGTGATPSTDGAVTPMKTWSATWGSWCGPGDDVSRWLVVREQPSGCAGDAQQIHGGPLTSSLKIDLTDVVMSTAPFEGDFPASRCVNGSCTEVTTHLVLDSFTEGGPLSGRIVVDPHGTAESAELRGVWCPYDDLLPPHPEGERLARDLGLTEVAVYQAVKVPIARDGSAVTERNAEIVQDRQALVRAFVSPGELWTPRPILGRLTIETPGRENRVYEETKTVTAPSVEAVLDSTFNFELDADAIAENSSYRVQLREVTACTELLGTVHQAKFPEVGTAPLGAHRTGVVKVRVVPIRYDGDGSQRMPDTSEKNLADMKARVMAMYPATGVEFSVREAVATDQSDFGAILTQMIYLRDIDSPPPDVAYYGLLNPDDTFWQYCGGSCVTGVATFGRQNGEQATGIGIGFPDFTADTFAHELGHIYRRSHAPCGGPAEVDPFFPYGGGRIGSWGYDATSKQLVDPDGEHRDLMGYCPPEWISDYNYQAIAERIRVVNGVTESLVPEARYEWRTMLIDEVGDPRWSLTVGTNGLPSGVAEPAVALDAVGQPIAEITVYRQELEDSYQHLVFVPLPDPSWEGIRVQGGATLSLSAPSSVTPFGQLN